MGIDLQIVFLSGLVPKVQGRCLAVGSDHLLHAHRRAPPHFSSALFLRWSDSVDSLKAQKVRLRECRFAWDACMADKLVTHHEGWGSEWRPSAWCAFDRYLLLLCSVLTGLKRWSMSLRARAKKRSQFGSRPASHREAFRSVGKELP